MFESNRGPSFRSYKIVAAASGYPNLAGAATAQYRQAPAGGVRQQGGQGRSIPGAGSVPQANARPITGQQQAAQVSSFQNLTIFLNIFTVKLLLDVTLAFFSNFFLQNFIRKSR